MSIYVSPYLFKTTEFLAELEDCKMDITRVKVDELMIEPEGEYVKAEKELDSPDISSLYYFEEDKTADTFCVWLGKTIQKMNLDYTKDAVDLLLRLSVNNTLGYTKNACSPEWIKPLKESEVKVLSNQLQSLNIDLGRRQSEYILFQALLNEAVIHNTGIIFFLS